MEEVKNLSNEKGSVQMEKLLDAPVAKVWEALTEPGKMRQWYFDTTGFKAEVGQEFSFKGGEPGQKPFVHLCRVTEVIPLKKIAYTWRYEGYEGESLLSFELSEQGKSTRLLLTHSGLDTFPAISSFKQENFEMGWKHFMRDGLPAYLQSNT